MHTAEPLTITNTALGRIKRLAAAATKSPLDERDLYFALKALSPDELTDIYALYCLGRPGLCSFNVALTTAKHQNLEHVPGMLSDNHHFGKFLKAGLKQYRKHAPASPRASNR